MRVELVVINGREIVVPQSLPGAAEFGSVVRAEAAADDLRDKMLAELDYRGGTPAAHVGLALDYRERVGAAVASAAVGLEAFANFHIGRALGTDGEWDLGDGH